MDELIAPIVDELNRALGIDRETLEKELTLLMIDFKVPAEEARRSIAKKHGLHETVPGNIKNNGTFIADATPSPYADPYRPLKDIRNGDSGITIIASVIDPEYRTISTQSGEVAVINGMVEDSTARVHFTSWVDVPDIFSVRSIVARNVYVKSFHGMPGINITEATTLEEYPGEIKPYATRRYSLSELSKTDGAYDIEVEGDVLSIRPGSGLIERCPECNRVMQKSQCRVHGKTSGVWDLRIKAVIDDGTGSMICVFDRTLTRMLTGVSIDDLLVDKDNPEKIEEIIKTAMIGIPLIVKGNATGGDYGMILVARQVSRPSDDIGAMAADLMGEMR